MGKRGLAVAALLAALLAQGVLGSAAPAQSAIVATGAERRCGNPTHKVQLTFDDMAHPSRVSAILDVLQVQQVRAGFFITGRWARDHGHLIDRIRRDGHWLGNHTATHADLARMSNAGIAGEIAGGVGGDLLRPPYGSANGRVRQVAADAGYRLCYWDIDTLDWRGRSAADIQRTVYSGLRPGAVVLAHLHGRHTLAALPDLIRGIRARGYELDGLQGFVAGAVGEDGSSLLLEPSGRLVGGSADEVSGPVVPERDAVAVDTRPQSKPGQWIASASGAIHAVGGAPFLGGAEGLAAPVVSVVSMPTGEGYWLASSDGGVFAFGDAEFFGSGVGLLAHPVVSMTPTPTGQGYWLLTKDGGVFAFGDALFVGSAAGSGGAFVDLAARPLGDGYWLLRRDGSVAAFGDAGHYGDYAGTSADPPGTRAFLAIAGEPDGGGYLIVSDRPGETYRYR